MTFLGKRLLEERERLSMTQPELAEKCGVTMRTQRNYEKGERSPDADYLAALAQQGLDVLYLLTGQRTQPVAPTPTISDGDRVLLDNFHAAPVQVQAGVKTALSAFTPSANRLNSKGAAKRKA